MDLYSSKLLVAEQKLAQDHIHEFYPDAVNPDTYVKVEVARIPVTIPSTTTANRRSPIAARALPSTQVLRFRTSDWQK